MIKYSPANPKVSSMQACGEKIPCELDKEHPGLERLVVSGILKKEEVDLQAIAAKEAAEAKKAAEEAAKLEAEVKEAGEKTEEAQAAETQAQAKPRKRRGRKPNNPQPNQE